MSSQGPTVIVFGLFVALLGGLWLLCPSILVQLGVDLPELPVLLSRYHEITLKREALDRRDAEMRICYSMRDRVGQGLIQGRITLLQAASLFCAANQRLDALRPRCYLQLDIPTEEWDLRDVIRWVRYSGAHFRASAGLAERLEAELERLRAQPGGLQLPTLGAEILAEYDQDGRIDSPWRQRSADDPGETGCSPRRDKSCDRYDRIPLLACTGR